MRVLTKLNSKLLELFLLWMLAFFLLLSEISCQKYLDKPNSKSLVIPKTLKDLQAILDGNDTYNNPDLMEVLADNYYITSSSWNAILANSNPYVSNASGHYIWNGLSISGTPIGILLIRLYIIAMWY